MQFVLTDTGPLWSFAIVKRLDLLGLRLEGRVTWTTAVAGEVRRNVAREPLLAEIFNQSWLPEPVDLGDHDLVHEALRVRQSLAAPGDDPRMHLGEAECIVYARHLGDACVLTEDRSAKRRANFDGLRVIRTTDILGELVNMGETDRATAWRIYEQLVVAGRLPVGLTPHELFDR